MKYKIYIMWWQQSLSTQALQYSRWKKTDHIFKGRTQQEAQRKMNKFLSVARITGRFLCVESGHELTTTGEETKSPMEQILQSAIV